MSSHWKMRKAQPVDELTPPLVGVHMGFPVAGKLAARKHAECVGFLQLLR